MSDPCDPVTVTSADGASLTCCAYGGHILGWTPAGAADDRLWLSPLRECGDGRAIRGGVPVIFPQFSDRGQLPRHGLARNRAWAQVEAGRTAEGSAVWAAQLAADDQTRTIWPHDFLLTLAAEATGGHLAITASVVNEGLEPFEFAFALHSYLSVGASASITGLGGLAAQDNAAGGSTITVASGPLGVLDARDIAVLAVPGPVLLSEPGRASLSIEASGLPDRVMWNPGPNPGIGDVPPGGEAEFVCVEPAALAPVRLDAGQRWSATATLTAG